MAKESVYERVTRLEREVEWLKAQLKNGLTDVATRTVEKILEAGLEAEVRNDTDLQIKELINNDN